MTCIKLGIFELNFNNFWWQEVKIGTSDVLMTSMDLDDSIPQPSLSSSPPQQNVGTIDKNTPPNSPNVSGTAPFIGYVFLCVSYIILWIKNDNVIFF